MKLSCRSVLCSSCLFVFFVAVQSQTQYSIVLAQATDAERTRQNITLEFPDDRSMGLLYARPTADSAAEDFHWLSSDWRKLGFAQGSVEIPAESFVRLDVAAGACDDLSPLSKLPVDAIHMLYFNIESDVRGQFKHIGRLTGLRCLRFRSCPLDDAGIKELAGLTNLELLTCSVYGYHDEGFGITDDSLEVIGTFHRLRSLNLRSNPITDEGLPALAACNSLETLSLDGTQVTGTGLDSLMMLPNLKRLSLGAYQDGAPVDDEGMKAIGLLGSLTYLNLNGTKITDAGLAHLGDLKDLEDLSIDYTDVSDDGLAYLEPLTKLKKIRFYKKSGDLGDRAAEHLSKLPNLEKITAKWKLSSDGFRDLAKLKKLKSVDFTDRVTDADLEWISQMSSLEDLRLSHCELTDQGIEKLTALKNLDSFSLSNTKATPACLKTLAKFPSLKHLRLRFEGDDHLGLRWPGKAWNDIANLVQLESLSIEGLLLSDQHWPALCKLKNLQRLEMERNHLVLTGSFFDAIQRLDRLNSLELGEVDVQNSDLEKLTRLKNLEYLNYMRGSLDDRGLSILARLPSLRILQLTSDKITDEGIAKFKSLSKSVQKVSVARRPVGYAMSLNKDGIVQNYNGPMREALDGLLGKPAPLISTEDPVNLPPGRSIDLSDYRGSVVLVDFWRAHVGHSRDENVHVKKIYEKYKDRGVKVIGIHTTRDAHRMADFISAHEIPWPCAVDKDNETANAWHTDRRYGIYLLDCEGNVRMSNIYPGDLQRALEIVLDESK